MLVFSRRKEEAAIITLPDGRRCEVRVLRVHKGVARLGFAFPSDCTVHRAEVQALVDAERRSA